MTPLSEQLAQLSVKAKRAEDNFARTQAQAEENIEHARRVARQTAQEAIDDLNRKVANVREANSTRWQAFKTKLQADGQRLKQDMAQDRREFSAWQKGNYAEACEEDAALAIDYAAASIAMAESAVLEAVEARNEAQVAQAAAAAPTAA